ncbi:MAG TPA: hypothetical protein VGO11_27725 [Chthoniobacteraceae bacterium]|jgi:hypothetical protein|nr:hypothetical protein [Chthoniobacteraceae bacterium]
MRSSIEVLESRIAPAGAVAVTYTPATGALVITASDNLAHSIHVFPTGPNTFRIEGQPIDGDLGPVTAIDTFAYEDVTGKLAAVRYVGGNGDDALHLNNFKSISTLGFDGKDGADTMDIDDVTTTGDVTIQFGANTPAAKVSGAFFSGNAITIGGSVVTDFGSGGGYIDFNAIANTIKGGVMLTGGAGADQFFVEGGTASIAKGINFTGPIDPITQLPVNAGDDLISFDGGSLVTVGKAADGRSIFFFGGADKDELSIYGAGLVNLQGKVQFDGGAGNNTTTVRADALTIGGDFNVTGGDDADFQDIAPLTLKVGGAVSMTLGNGANEVDLFALSMTVSKTFSYTGGTGTDDFSLDGTTLTLSGGLDVKLGAGANTVDLSPRIMKITAASALLPALSIVGGAAGDDIEVSPHSLTVTGTTLIGGGDGTNTLKLQPENGTFTKDVVMSGGLGDDTFDFGRDIATLKSNLTFTLGAGTNRLEIQPDVMTVAKDLKISGAADPLNAVLNPGDDTVHLDAGALKVMGVAEINLGDGINKVDGYMTTASFAKTLTYLGGAVGDTFDLGGTFLAVKGKVDLQMFEGTNDIDLHESTITLSDAFSVSGGDGANTVFLGSRTLSVAKATTITYGSGGNTVNLQAAQAAFGAITVTATGGDDQVNFSGTKLAASGLVKFDLGDGANVTTINSTALGLKAGLTILSGAGADYASLFADGTITGDVNIDLGAGSADDQTIYVTGNSGLPGILKINGALTLNTAATDAGLGKAEFIYVYDVTVTKAITVTAAGDAVSNIYLNNANPGGTLTVSSGAGKDDVQIETFGTFGPMTVAKTTTINLGDGDDTLAIGFSHDPGSNDFVKFMGAVTVDGGIGTDTVSDLTVNVFGPGVPAPVLTNVP